MVEIERLEKVDLNGREDKARKFVEETDHFTLATVYVLIHAQAEIDLEKAGRIRRDYYRRMIVEKKSN